MDKAPRSVSVIGVYVGDVEQSEPLYATLQVRKVYLCEEELIRTGGTSIMQRAHAIVRKMQEQTMDKRNVSKLFD